VMILLVLALKAAGGLEAATLAAVEQTGPSFVFGPGYVPIDPAVPDAPEWRFLPMGLAFSFFAIWVFAGLGSPAGTVRIMACKSTGTIRRSIYLLAAYNSLIYIPLIAICICGRAIVPDLPHGQTDQIIPRLAITLTQDLPGGSFLAGLILAAPFGAVMATVSSYLVVIASGLVRDIYQRFLNTDATDRQLKWWSHAVMIVVGGLAVAANIKPPPYLQAVVVFSGTGAAATFFVPLMFVAFWRRSTVAGVLAAMLTGGGTMVALYALGTFSESLGLASQAISYSKGLRPYYLFEIDPLLWGLGASLVVGVIVSLLTAPPREPVVSALFDANPDRATLGEMRADSIDSRLSEAL
jgi:sodium/pantothenate symporter